MTETTAARRSSEATPGPSLDAFAHGPGRSAYLSPDILADEIDALFAPTWNFACHEGELADAGDFVVYSLLDREVVLARSRSGDVRGYHNFCPHRGHRLCTTESGQLGSKITCPYHGWAFAIEEGQCVAANRMPANFDKASSGLSRVWTEVFAGMVFVSFSTEQPPSIAEFTEPVGTAGFDFDRMKVAARRERVFEANWKVVHENNLECYHCTMNHSTYCSAYDPWWFSAENQRRYANMDGVRAWAVDSYTGGEPPQACRVPLPRSNPDQPPRQYSLYWNPGGGLTVYTNANYAWVYDMKPLGPETTLVRELWLVSEDAVEDRDFVERDLVHFLEVTTLEEDPPLCAEVQRGLRMRDYQPGPLHPNYQAPAIEFYDWREKRLTALANGESLQLNSPGGESEHVPGSAQDAAVADERTRPNG